MIECLFTLDYEIFGNGSGSLRELVLDPTRRLISIFKERDSTFVLFPEMLELDRIEKYRADEAIGDVRSQIAGMRRAGIELGLHLHSWWGRAAMGSGSWVLDREERNLCLLSRGRIEDLVGEGIEVLRRWTDSPSLTPVAFRNGLWVLQPTPAVAGVLSRFGIRVDSTVFKGGRIRDVGVDYRPSLKNGSFWRFGDDVNAPDPNGVLLEVPIHTEMVPFWAMAGRTRPDPRKKSASTGEGGPLRGRWADFARFRYPRKLDFCRMSFPDLRAAVERAIRHDRKNPQAYTPIVAIGHSKDLVDFETLRRFLDFLIARGVGLTDFGGVLKRLAPPPEAR